MTGMVGFVLLATGLLGSALIGPWVLQHAAPALMHRPRLAIGLMTGTIIVWLAALVALGPLLAWAISGPALLPGGAGAVCQQCLAAANPLRSTPIDTVVPVALLLILPAIGVTLHVISMIVELTTVRSTTTQTAAAVGQRGTADRLQGYRVLVTDDPHPFAFTLPERHGGIVVSTAALDTLSPESLAAVLAHEDAHLRQRHHLIATLTTSLVRRMRWVPLLAAAEDALGHYLEIAADDQARRRVGRNALASALLTLGRYEHPHPGANALGGVLHAVGPDRVRHLVLPGNGTAGMIFAAISTGCLAALTALSASVYVPYAVAAITGCL